MDDVDILTANLDAIQAHYEATAAGARNAMQEKANGVFGSIFGPGQQELSALNADIGNDRAELAARRDKVLAGTQSFDDFVAAAKADENDIAEAVGYTIESSLDDVIQKTATQTGSDVKQTVNLVAETAVKATAAAIPGWVYIVGLLYVAWQVGALKKLSS